MKVSKHPLAQAYNTELQKVANAVPPVPPGAPSLMDTSLKALGLASMVVPLVGATAAGASAIYDKMTAASRKANAFKAMVEQNPHLLADRDQATVQRYFNTLHHVNPGLAMEPTIAASYVNNMLTTSDPARGYQPHRDIFTTALSASGKGGPPAPGFGESMMGIGKELGSLHKSLEDSKYKGENEKIRAMAKEVQGDAKRQQRMYGMGKARERSAYGKMEQAQQATQRVSDDAAYFQQRLDETGTSY